MADLHVRDIAYRHGDTEMLGLLVAPAHAAKLPTVVLVHDAFGLSDDMVEIARSIASRDYTVFAADVWGNRQLPTSESEIGPLIGGMVSQRDEWIARIAAAHETAAAQPEVDGSALISLGYCFGGASALEYLRTGGSVLGVVSIHGGLDLLEFDWARAKPGSTVLVCTGAADPMATPEQREQLLSGLDAAGIDWELDLYSNTVHAFTSKKAQDSPAPHVIAYHPRNATRAMDATLRFIDEVFAARAH